MSVLDMVAKEFHVSPKELLKDSLRTYLEKRLGSVEADIYLIAKKHGVKDILELDSRIKEGFISEKEGFDDYFVLDNLEAERDKIKSILDRIA